MLATLERELTVHDLLLGTNPTDAKDVPLASVMAWISYLKEEDENADPDDERNCYWPFQKNEKALWLDDFSFESEHEAYVLLLSLADTTVTDPAFKNLESGEVRISPKLTKEGIAVSAHVIISSNPYSDNNDRYIFMMERVPGISKTRFMSFLARLFKKCVELGGSEFMFEEGGRERKFTPVASTVDHPSLSLRESLEEGALVGAELVQDIPDHRLLDDAGHIRQERHLIQVRTDGPVGGSEAIKWARRITKLAKDLNYGDVRLRYKDPETKKERAVPVRAHTDDVAKSWMTRRELVKVDRPLEQCAAEIRHDFVFESLKILDDIRKEADKIKKHK